jgi:hypothetical protein
MRLDKALNSGLTDNQPVLGEIPLTDRMVIELSKIDRKRIPDVIGHLPFVIGEKENRQNSFNRPRRPAPSGTSKNFLLIKIFAGVRERMGGVFFKKSPLGVMKNLRVLIIPIVMLVLVTNCVLSADMLRDRGVLLEPIGGEELLCVVNTGDENGAYWFILKEMGQNRAIGSNLSALHEVNQILASPGSTYLAVHSVGEGHPMVEVIDLEKLRQQGKYVVLHLIDPYPGTVWIVRWEGLRLIVSSDMPLPQRKQDGRVDADLMLPKNEEFYLDVETGTIGSFIVEKKN